MSKHTPGPWTVDDIYIESAHGCRPGETEVLAVAVGRPNKLEHNARLIAAAPEMYEAMRRFRNAFVGWIEARDSWDDEEIADAEDFLDDTRKDLIDLFERIEGETK